MPRVAISWWRHGGISRRIAITMIVSLIAIQVQAFLQIWAFSQPEMRLTGVDWFANTAAAAYRTIFAAAPTQRTALAAALEQRLKVKLLWQPEPRPADQPNGSTSVTTRLTATLVARLGAEVPRLIVSQYPLHGPFPVHTIKVTLSPADLTARLNPATIRPGEPDELMPPDVRVSIQGPDGTWLRIEPVAFAVQGPLARHAYIPIVIGGLIIAGFSLWTARSLITPLERLVTAAERIGHSREFVAVAAQGLHEFAAVARAFEDMQQRLLHIVDDRTQMLGAISHDLRSSLTRLRIATETGEGEMALLREIDEMQVMLESTLMFARGDADRGPMQPTDIAALLISIVDDAVDAGWHVTYSGPDHAELKGAPLTLKRAFRNLIDNAVKYGGEAKVSLGVSESVVHIQIADHGPGIPGARVEEAFLPFRRLDQARSGTIPGAGLGLTIARDAIQSHGGTVSLTSPSSGGLVVDVTIPRHGPSSQGRSPIEYARIGSG